MSKHTNGEMALMIFPVAVACAFLILAFIQ